MARQQQIVSETQMDPRDRGIDVGEWLGLTTEAAVGALGARYLIEGGRVGERVPLMGHLPPGVAEEFARETTELLYDEALAEGVPLRIPVQIVAPERELPWPYNTKWIWVLSGGAAKGAFQLGAALYLMGKDGISPQGIAGTSVGAVNALALAEFYYTGVEKLRDIWLGLSDRSDMYAWAPWVEDVNRVLRPHGLDVRKLLALVPIAGLSGELSLPPLTQLLSLEGFEATIFEFFTESTEIAFIASLLTGPFLPLAFLGILQSATEDLKNAISRAMQIIGDQSDGLFTFTPLRRLMERFLDVRRMGIPIRFVAVGVSDGRVYHALSDLDRPEGARVIMVEEQPEGGLVHTELGTLAIAEPGQRLIQAALASASIPFANPPLDWPISLVPGGETYKTDTKAFVDGGVREVLPVEAGLAMFDDELAGLRGPRGVIAISVSAPFIDPDDLVPIVKPELNPLPPVESNAAADFNILEMASLGFSHATDEVVNNELRFALEGIPNDIDHILIAPSISMSSPNRLDPGMTQLLLAYGYMTAFDEMTRRQLNLNYEEYRERLWCSTNEIMQARYLCWRIERGGEGFRLVHPDWRLHAEIGNLGNLDDWREVVVNPSDFDWDALSRDFDWVIADDRLDRRLERRPGEPLPSLRELKRHIHEWVDTRVRQWGLESIPDVHDLSNFEVGNENHPVDWWRRFERHGYAEDIGVGSYPTGPGTVIQDYRSIYPFRRPGSYLEGLMPGNRPETSPWNAAIVFTTEVVRGTPGSYPPVSDRFLRFVPEETLPLSPFERAPDYGVVRLEGYILADDFEPPAGTETVELFSMWNPELTDHWTGSLERGKFPPAPGHGSREIEGRIFDPERLKPPDTIPLVTWYSPSRNDHLTTSGSRFTFDPEEEVRRRIPPDYQFQRVIGYLYSPYLPQSELRRRFRQTVLPLWRWYSPSRRDFFTTTNPNWRTDFGNLADEILEEKILR